MEKKDILLIHGGPGFDDSYFFPYLSTLRQFNNLHSYTIGENLESYSLDSLLNQLEEKIKKIQSDNLFIIAHSFAAILALQISKKSLSKVKRIILSNWVYNAEWIDIFYSDYPELKDYKSKSLKEDTLFYCPYYFNNTQVGTPVLNKINYNDKLQLELQGVYKNLNLEQNIGKIKGKLVSITGNDDKLTPPKYILPIVKKHNIKNINILNAGHFPFIEQQNSFITAINNIIGENDEHI